jgi:hypothetical protein
VIAGTSLHTLIPRMDLEIQASVDTQKWQLFCETLRW